MMKESSAKLQRRELKECIRMTSVSCTSEPQVGLISSIVVLILLFLLFRPMLL